VLASSQKLLLALLLISNAAIRIGIRSHSCCFWLPCSCSTAAALPCGSPGCVLGVGLGFAKY